MPSNDLISVIILTYNEEQNLPFCLESIKGVSSEIFIVDSGSQDKTREIAQSYGAKLYNHPFENQAKQLNWALDHLPICSPWCLRLDADESLTPELVDELRKELPVTPSEVTAYFVKRRVYFWGKWIRFGGYYPTWLLRVWRTGTAKSEERKMDEHMLISSGKTMKLRCDIIDQNRKGLSFWVDKHNAYAEREAQEILMVKTNGQGSNTKLSGQARRRRWLKENLYLRLPIFFRPLCYWAFRYFMLLGFLDGLPGFVFHFLQGFWYRFLIDAKLFEAKGNLANKST